MAAHPPEKRRRRKSGQLSFGSIASAGAIFISGISLGVAIYQGRIMERLAAANAMPYVTVESSNYLPDRANKAAINVSLRNVGVGPASVKSLQVYRNGQAVRSADDLFTACCGQATAQNASTIIRNQDLDRFIPAGERSLLFEFAQTAANREVWSKFDRVRTELSYDVCYCSVFDDCYRLRTGRGVRMLRTRLRQCPMTEQPQFVP